MRKFSMKSLIWCAPMAALMAGPALATDYDDATPSIYVQDAANEALMLPKILSCILDQAGVGASDKLTNANWAALVNEKTCDLGDSDTTTFAKAVLSSERASADTAQEVVGWMDTSMGEKMIMSAVLTEAPTEEDPFGRYSVTFYQANPEGGDTTISPSDLTQDSDPAMYGYAYIYSEGADVVIDAYMQDSVLDGMEMRTRAVIKDGNPDNVRYAFEMDSQWMQIAALGATSGDKSFRYLLDDAGDAIGAECTSRTTAWQNTWEMALYEKDTGEKFQLPYPSLSFNTEEGNYGDVNSDWYWIDGDERFSLTPTNNELSFSPMNGGEDKTLVWAPSDMSVVKDVPYTPAEGDVVRYWIWDNVAQEGQEVDALYNADNGGFYYMDGGSLAKVPTDRNVWSQQYNMNIYIGLDSNGDETYVGKKNQYAIPSADSYLFYADDTERTVATAAKLYCVGWSCPDQNLGMGADDVVDALKSNNGDLPWEVFHTPNRNQNSVFTYFLAPLKMDADSDFVAGALYHDSNDSGSLDAGDKPVMFDFRLDWRDDAAYAWDGTEEVALTDALDAADNPWIGFYFDLVPATCDLEVSGSTAYDLFEGCDKITYHHNPYNAHAYVRNADGTYYEFSEPKILKLADFDPAVHDRNYNYAENALINGYLPEIGTVADGDWNPVTGASCNVNTWQTEFADMVGETGMDWIYTDSDTGAKYCLVPVAPDYFEGKTFYLNYDGRALHGINGVDNVLLERWFQMVNLKSGTELVDVNDPTKVYKVKPVYIDEYLQNLTDVLDPTEDGAIDKAKAACAGDDIVFELDGSTEMSTTMLGLLEGLPPVWFDDTYVKPTAAWSDRPTVTPTGNCFVKDKEVICPAD